MRDLPAELRRCARAARRWADELDKLAERAEGVDTAPDSVDDVTEAAIDRLLADRGYVFEEETCGS